jgi:hypothetical protein
MQLPLTFKVYFLKISLYLSSMNPQETFKALTKSFNKHKFKPLKLQELATERAKICSECEHCDTAHKFKKLAQDGESIEETTGIVCKAMECNSCLLSARIRQRHTRCPNKHWGENQRVR